MRKLIVLLLLAAPAAWPCASGSPCTFWFFDTAVGSYGKLDEGSQPGVVQTTTSYSATVTGSGAGGCGDSKDPIVYAATTTGADCNANGPTAPGGSNGLRTLNPITGTFAAANWTVAFQGISNFGQAQSTWSFNFRVYKGANATGSGAVEITAAEQVGGLQAVDNATHTFSVAFNPGALTFTNEYIFVSIAGRLHTTALTGVTFSSVLETGATKVLTSTFTSTVPQRLMLGVGQ